MFRKITLWLLALIVVVGIAGLVWDPLTATTSLPPPAKTYDARIVRDEWGVPHIFGKTDADTAYGLAYAHAEDDFSTLQEVIAMTRGRLLVHRSIHARRQAPDRTSLRRWR